ncbi:HIT family protein [Synechococcus elongatus]|uniref:HIT family protein n=1 Tax=Synechococcus elongatus PCC 11801 TaxID=2219813 RepID=A0AAN1QPM1_SYNEL|nr:HIT family protein [Synechococcus elongatus]AZB73058.1 HIT family protein [Synechococcus elongatus PCC 11801]
MSDGLAAFGGRASLDLLAENDWAVAFRDRYPVSPGHSLVVPKRAVQSLFELPPEEFQSSWELVAIVRSQLQERYQPDAFNIGINDGLAAGQTITQAHIHLIPRYSGDRPDPRGGIRWVLPEQAAYWLPSSNTNKADFNLNSKGDS